MEIKTKKNKIKIFIRTRPSSKFCRNCFQIDGNRFTATRSKPGGKITLNVDGILVDVSQEEVFETINRESDIVNNLLEGFRGCVISYGAAAGGKTYTISGSTTKFSDRGLIPRTLNLVYSKLAQMKYMQISFVVRISAFSVYNNNLVDLLIPGQDYSRVNVNEIIQPSNILCHSAVTEEDALSLFLLAEKNRFEIEAKQARYAFGNWAQNVFSITVESKQEMLSVEESLVGTLWFIELPGVSGNLVEPLTRQQLNARKAVSSFEHNILKIRSGHTAKAVTCTRCRLSRILKEVLEGNSMITIILNVRTEQEYIQSTFHNLRFAKRISGWVSNSQQVVKVEENVKTKNLEAEIAMLKRELYLTDLMLNRKPLNYDTLNIVDLKILYADVKNFLANKTDAINVKTFRHVHETFNIFRNVYSSAHEECKVSALSEAELPQSDLEDVEKTPELTIEKISEPHVSSGSKLGFAIGPASPTDKGDIEPLVEWIVNARDENSEQQTLPSIAEDIAKPEEASKDVETQRRNELFEEYKLRMGKPLNTKLIELKRILMTKQQEYNVYVKDIAKIRADMEVAKTSYNQLKHKHTIPSVAEAIAELTDRLDYLINVIKTKANFLKVLFQEVSQLEKSVMDARIELLQDFEVWYEKKMSVLQYQELLASSAYQKSSAGAHAIKSHRHTLKSVDVTIEAENTFMAAKKNVKRWTIHHVPRQLFHTSKIPTYEFLTEHTPL